MNIDSGIAIVGMAGRFPGAASVDEFWQNLADGVESITQLSDEEILKAGVSPSYLTNRNYVKAAPVLERPDHFDAMFFGFSPIEAKTMDPQHRILLELAWEALENAGYDPNRHEGRVGVFTGTAMNTYFMNRGLNSRFTEEYIPTLIVNDKDFLSTRISYKLNLKGPSITIQTACSTSLVAIHLACQSLFSEETDMALAGAVSVRFPHRAGYVCDGGGVVSPDGRVRSFDAAANGTVFGSGGGILVLKRLADAISSGDSIHAVIRGSAVNNDGSEKAGYTAPSVNSQADAVVEALANAGLTADSISYIEAHGSGTPVGDPIEILALTKAFRAFTPRSGYCAVGSVKTNVGHLDAAAGVAGIIKTVLALKHRQLPPSLHFNKANPEIDFPNTPFYVNTQLVEWTSQGPRRAGVMSTGMGGTNAHVVLEEAPEPAATAKAGPSQLLVLSAKTATALDQVTLRLREFLNRNVSVNMDDVAFTLQVGRKAFPYRRSLVCADREDAISALGDEHPGRVLSSRVDESARRPLIFLLPGIGDHYVGMAHDLYETWDVFRQEVDRCSLILERHLGIDIRKIIYPNSHSWRRDGKTKGIDLKKMLGRGTDAPEDLDATTLNQTLFAQPALFTIEYALSRLWRSLGITPDAIVGHSMGEYVAACLAGVLSLEDALQLIAVRAKLVNELPQGAMLAVTLSERELLPLLPDHLSIALINGPRLCVVAGPVAAVAAFETTLKGMDVTSRHVQNAHAFHSRMLDPIVQAFEEEVKRVQLNPPSIPYVSSVTGTWITAAEATDPAYWARHVNHPARFSEALHELWQHRDAILLEVGPGRTLGVLAMQHPERTQAGDPVAVSSLRHHYENESDAAFLLRGICKLWLAGVDVRWEEYHADQSRRRISLPTYPFERQPYWLEVETNASQTPRAQHAGAAHSSIDDWFYVPGWERSLFPDASAAESNPDGASWLIVGDRYGGGANLKAQLEKRGVEAAFVYFGAQFGQRRDGSFELNPASADDYLKLFTDLNYTSARALNILHLGGLTRDETTGPSVCPSSQNFGFYSLLHIAQAIGELNIAIPVNIGVLSNRILEVTGEEALNPEMATVLGLSGVIPKEFQNVSCFNIDLPDTQAIDDLPPNTLARILAEFSGTPKNQVVAYRGQYRWRQRYDHVTLPTPVQPDATGDRSELGRLRRGGVYLITGGTGGIGLAIAKYLATTCQPKIVLTKKTAFPAKSTWRALSTDSETLPLIRRTIKALLELEDLGAEVEVIVADSADKHEMQNVRDQILARFRTINGVIHAAGIVRAGLIQAKTKKTAESVLAPKVYGTMILFDLFKNADLDFLVLLSSVASIIAPYAHADYSAANTFLDAFAYFANTHSGFRTITINWPVWKEVGVVADLQTLSGVEDWKEAALKNAITTRDGLEVFRRALNSNLKHVVVSPEDFNNLWEQSQLPVDPAVYLSGFGRRDELPRQPDEQGNHRVALPALTTTEDTSSRAGSLSQTSTEEELAGVWCQLLSLPRVGADDDFFELGGHSLLGIRLMGEIQKRFGVKLPLSSLFRNRTIREQARVLTDGPTAVTWSPIVAIQPRGTRPPFFLVHGIGGEVLTFEALARHLGSDQPIYGVQADTGKGRGFFSSVEEVATTYLRRIREHTPSGPYRLGGYSSGGIIAYEMAQQLRAAGEQVAILVMLDSDASPHGSKARLTPASVWRIFENAAYWLVDDDFFSLSREEKLTRLASKARAMYSQALQATVNSNGHSKADIRDRLGLWQMPEETRDPLEAHFNMLCAYRPRPYPGSVTVLRARTDRLMSRAGPDNGWQPLALGGVNVVKIPGAHDNILKEPRVRLLAAALDATLRGALEPAGGVDRSLPAALAGLLGSLHLDNWFW